MIVSAADLAGLWVAGENFHKNSLPQLIGLRKKFSNRDGGNIRNARAAAQGYTQHSQKRQLKFNQQDYSCQINVEEEKTAAHQYLVRKINVQDFTISAAPIVVETYQLVLEGSLYRGQIYVDWRFHKEIQDEEMPKGLKPTYHGIKFSVEMFMFLRFNVPRFLNALCPEIKTEDDLLAVANQAKKAE